MSVQTCVLTSFILLSAPNWKPSACPLFVPPFIKFPRLKMTERINVTSLLKKPKDDQISLSEKKIVSNVLD